MRVRCQCRGSSRFRVETEFEGVSNEDRDGAVKGCEEGDEARLDLSKDGRGSSKGCFRRLDRL